jgi:hypothetical protein
MALVEVRQRLFNYLKTKMAMDLNLEIRHHCWLIIYLCYVSIKTSLYVNHASYGIPVVVPNFGDNYFC